MKKYIRTDVFYPKTETRLSIEEMLKLKNRYDVFDAKTELTKIVEFVFNTKLKSFEKIIAWGLDHLLFRIVLENKRSYVVRINNTSIGDDYFEVEKLVYEALQENSIQECKLYFLERRESGNFNYDFIILDNLLDGDFEKLLLNNYFTTEEEGKLVYKSGEFLRKIHNIKTNGFGFFKFEDALKGKLIGEQLSWKEYFMTAFTNNIKETYDLGFVEKGLIKRTEKLIPRFDSLLNYVKPVLLHGDYCDHNIIVNRKDVVGAIDLTDCMSGDYLHDIAFWLSFYNFERLNIFLKGYFDHENCIHYEEFYVKLYFYLLRINYSKAILRYKYGIVEKIPLAIEKIQTSLSYLELN